MRMTVIGCGHLGATHAACMAELGHDVLGVDIDDGRVALLNSGKAWFYEPALDEMLVRNMDDGRLRFTTSFGEAGAFADTHFLGVATPGSPDGSYDLSQVHAAVQLLAPYLGRQSLIIGKSTVPPGTAFSLQQMLATKNLDTEVAWNPEFLREGSAVQDTLRPDRIVVGTSSAAALAKLEMIYEPLTVAGIPMVYTDLTTAELVKEAANAFLATKITFINAMADICVAAGGDITALATALGMDPRIGRTFLHAGIGYGGACLPKDVLGLAAFANNAGTRGATELLTLINKINAARRDRVVDIIRRAIEDVSMTQAGPAGQPLTGRRIAIWGAAFKPGTDDVRDSPSLDIADRLHKLGAQVTIYDPMAASNALMTSPHLAYADSAIAAAHEAHVIAVLTAWPQFAEISPAVVPVCSRVLVDGCQGINLAKWRAAGWRVSSLTSVQPQVSGDLIAKD